MPKAGWWDVIESWQGALLTTLGLDLGEVWPLGCPPVLLGDLFLCLLFSNHLAQVLLFPPHHTFCLVLNLSPSFPLLLSLCLIFFQLHLSLSPLLPPSCPFQSPSSFPAWLPYTSQQLPHPPVCPHLFIFLSIHLCCPSIPCPTPGSCDWCTRMAIS